MNAGYKENIQDKLYPLNKQKDELARQIIAMKNKIQELTKIMNSKL